MTGDDVDAWARLFERAPDDVGEATVREVLAAHRHED